MVAVEFGEPSTVETILWDTSENNMDAFFLFLAKFLVPLIFCNSSNLLPIDPTHDDTTGAVATLVNDPNPGIDAIGGKVEFKLARLTRLALSAVDSS